MKTINISQAEGPVLDWLVAKANGDSEDALESYVDGLRCQGEGDYSTDWSQGGPIIEREGISVMRVFKDWPHPWCADHDESYFVNAPTPLIAAMRCFCASKLGETVEVPEELT